MPSFAAFGTPRGILRLVEIVFAIIAFATMADENGFSAFSQFSYLVAANVIAFVWAFFIVLVYIFQDKVDNACLYTPIVELVTDGIVTLLVFAAGCAAATKCNDKIDLGPFGGSTTICKESGHVTASVVFTFFTFLLFAVSTFLSYRSNVAEEKKPNTTTAAPQTTV